MNYRLMLARAIELGFDQVATLAMAEGCSERVRRLDSTMHILAGKFVTQHGMSHYAEITKWQ